MISNLISNKFFFHERKIYKLYSTVFLVFLLVDLGHVYFDSLSYFSLLNSIFCDISSRFFSLVFVELIFVS